MVEALDPVQLLIRAFKMSSSHILFMDSERKRRDFCLEEFVSVQTALLSTGIHAKFLEIRPVLLI